MSTNLFPRNVKKRIGCVLVTPELQGKGRICEPYSAATSSQMKGRFVKVENRRVSDNSNSQKRAKKTWLKSDFAEATRKI